jgi:hypothetical protein
MCGSSSDKPERIDAGNSNRRQQKSDRNDNLRIVSVNHTQIAKM